MAIRKNNITRERDQFTVVLEAIQSDFQIFGEKMEMIEEKMDAGFDEVKDLIAKNSEDIEMIKIDLHFIGNDIKKKTNREETMLLEKRVTVLEKSGK